MHTRQETASFGVTWPADVTRHQGDPQVVLVVACDGGGGGGVKSGGGGRGQPDTSRQI